MVESGYRVVTGTSPGVATQQAFPAEVKALEGAMFLYGLYGILRAGGSKAATGTQ